MKEVFNAKVWLAGLLLASLLLSGTVVFLVLEQMTRGMPTLGPAAAALTVLPAPTGTTRPPPPTLTPIWLTPTPSLAILGDFRPGVYVQVNTQGSALRIRAEPSLNAPPLFLAFDEEVFLITDGPRQADGYWWWYLTASYDASRAGWAVQDYLTVISSP
ncbi:MAG: hypothetical protein N2049_07605 [Anaerolineales bacterium]|nr:hypothetical protein [Anaerolineales bacterium]MCX7609067.1 hypothetical protein [Anaerolineales bacterium]MDW8227992.1 hypothetical protein [Anaerolineales bacterium]